MYDTGRRAGELTHDELAQGDMYTDLEAVTEHVDGLVCDNQQTSRKIDTCHRSPTSLPRQLPSCDTLGYPISRIGVR